MGIDRASDLEGRRRFMLSKYINADHGCSFSIETLSLKPFVSFFKICLLRQIGGCYRKLFVAFTLLCFMSVVSDERGASHCNC